MRARPSPAPELFEISARHEIVNYERAAATVLGADQVTPMDVGDSQWQARPFCQGSSWWKAGGAQRHGKRQQGQASGKEKFRLDLVDESTDYEEGGDEGEDACLEESEPEQQVEAGGLIMIAFSLIGAYSSGARSGVVEVGIDISAPAWARQGVGRVLFHGFQGDPRSRKNVPHSFKVENSRQSVGNQLVMDSFAELTKPGNVALRSAHHKW